MDKNNRNILIGLALLLGLYFFMRARKKTKQLDETMNNLTNGSGSTVADAPPCDMLIVCYSQCPDSTASTHEGCSTTCEELGLLSEPPACANPNDADPCPQGMATQRSMNARGMAQSVCVGDPVVLDDEIDIIPSTITDQFPTLSNFAEAQICPKLCTYWGSYENGVVGNWNSQSTYTNLQGFLTELNYFIEVAQSEYGVTYTPEQAINWLKEDCRKYTNSSLSDPQFYGCSFALVDNQTLADALLINWQSYGAGDSVNIPSIQTYFNNALIDNLGTGVSVGNELEADTTTDLVVSEADLGSGFGNTNLGSNAVTVNSVLDTLGTSIPTALQTNLTTK